MHRDIKGKLECYSENNIFYSKGKVLIGDFGLACKVHSTKPSHLQNANWRAPELWLGIQNYDHKVDIFNAGVLMFKLFTRKSYVGLIPDKITFADVVRTLGAQRFLDWPEAK